MDKTRNTTFNPTNTAVVVIEFQKTWTQKGNFLNLLIRKPLRKNKIVQKTKAFLNTARDKDYTIIQAPLVLDKSNREEYKKMTFMPKVWGAFTKGTWKAEFEDGIYKKNDEIATGRTGFDACEGSNLVQLLWDNKVENVLLGGFLTDQCVEATMKTLEKNNFNCFLIKDATATVFPFIQKGVERRTKSFYSEELLNMMS